MKGAASRRPLVSLAETRQHERLTAAGGSPAVAARVARACADHAASAAVALDRVFERVEERGLARGRLLGGRRLDRAPVRVAGRQPGPDLGGQDPDLFLLVDREELLA